MTGLHTLRAAPGSRHRKKLLGRGVGTGHGRTSTRGSKGQKSRSGDGKMIGFEGGQMPLLRRIPKRGFTNKFRVPYNVVSLKELNARFEAGDSVTIKVLRDRGIVKRNGPIKILGSGQLEKKLSVQVDALSKSARTKIEAAGGSVEQRS